MRVAPGALPCALGALLGLAACVDGTGAAPAPGSTRRDIVGGAPDPGDPAVVLLQTQAGSCTGSLVAPNVVLTAAHCVRPAIDAGSHAGVVIFGAGRDEVLAEVQTQQLVAHRYFVEGAFRVFDIALVRLAGSAPAEVAPIEFNVEPLPPSLVGTLVRTVGFGLTDPQAQGSSGTKRQVQLPVDGLTAEHVVLGDDLRNTCSGDSGGPTLHRFPDNVERVIAVTSYGQADCGGESRMARTDAHRAFLLEVLDAWTGPCKADGSCVQTGCRTPDPDCDPCGFQGQCAGGCSRVDLDCPLGKPAGALCEDDDQCESRQCLPARDDPRISYCSQSCDPALPALETCAAPLTLCTEVEGAPRCVFSDITPSAQGAPCAGPGDCRSGICDSEHRICVEPCGGDDGSCAAPYQCVSKGGQRVCSFAEDGCDCAVGRAAGPPWSGLALAGCGVLGFAVRRRARRAPRRSR